MTTLLEPTTVAAPRPVRPAAPAVAGAPAAIPAAPRTARDASIDVARAWCLAVVVALHTFMVGVSIANGAPLLENAMDGWGGFAALTWFAQVMPLFFVLGGFSSATQWTRLRERGVSAHDYVAMRMRRLLPPALGAMAVTAVVLLVLTLTGVPGDMVAVAGFRMSQPLWFLGVYLLCTALVPLLTAAHRAAPGTALLALAALVVGVDAARIASGIEALGFANLLFVWLLLQQLGFLLADGRVPTHRAGLLAGASVGLGALAALCAVGVYSVDLYDNLNPPTAALVLLGIAQLCLFQLARPALRRLHGIRAVRAAVSVIGARAMTIYSWHMLVLIGLAGILLVTVGDGLPAPLTEAWWLTRPLWIVSVGVVVALLVAIVGRREAAAETRGSAAPAHPAAAVAALLLAAGGVVLVLLFGAAVAAWFCGALLLVGALRLATR
ncbi:MAG: acyltransferase family protein [Protaetiibacter sp.]